jgi:hypothetical protein
MQTKRANDAASSLVPRNSGGAAMMLRDNASPELSLRSSVICLCERGRQIMDFGRGALLWLLGVPLPIILLLALFWHH